MAPRKKHSAAPTDGWGRHRIGYEIKKAGLTYVGIARAAGLYDSACREAVFGKTFPGALALSQALSVPFRVMFGQQYRRQIEKWERDNNFNKRRQIDAPRSGAVENREAAE